jgi:hypothetical protein
LWVVVLAGVVVVVVEVVVVVDLVFVDLTLGVVVVDEVVVLESWSVLGVVVVDDVVVVDSVLGVVVVDAVVVVVVTGVVVVVVVVDGVVVVPVVVVGVVVVVLEDGLGAARTDPREARAMIAPVEKRILIRGRLRYWSVEGWVSIESWGKELLVDHTSTFYTPLAPPDLEVFDEYRPKYSREILPFFLIQRMHDVFMNDQRRNVKVRFSKGWQMWELRMMPRQGGFSIDLAEHSSVALLLPAADRSWFLGPSYAHHSGWRGS